ncbi:MAG: hypothetical protein WDO74_04725 [Pseudomonadota bacterium]
MTTNKPPTTAPQPSQPVVTRKDGFKPAPPPPPKNNAPAAPVKK